MPTATVRVTAPKNTVVNRTPRSKRVVIRQVEGNLRSIKFPIGPLQVKYDGGGIDYVNVDRPGEVALLEASTIMPRTIGFEAVIANPDTSGLSSVEAALEVLENIYKEDSDLTFTYGVRSLPYKLRMTGFSYSSARRDLNGNILQAVANIQLTERPRREIDPITLSAVRYTPEKSTSSSKKNTKTTTRPPSNSAGDDRYIPVTDPDSYDRKGRGSGTIY
jgi:hypothetical protein